MCGCPLVNVQQSLLRYLNINIWGALSGVVVIQSHHPPRGLISTESSSVLLWKGEETF